VKISELAQYGIPEEILRIWEGEGPGKIETLLPVQIAAVTKYRLFEGTNILVFSPTSSGKTFIGEMAAVKAALQGRRVFYLVPQKALAEEKYQEFRRKYDQYEVRTVISTRDRREYDEAIANLDFEIAVVVFEKMQSLVVSRPSLISRAGCIVVDELQLIADTSRGPDLELLLTKVSLSLQKGQLVGLSAVLGNSQELADWLGAQLLEEARRPVELRRGILYHSEFHYEEQNSGDDGVEDFCSEAAYGDEKAVITAAALERAEQGETSLVFRRSRRETVEWATHMANRSTLPSSDRALADLEEMEDSLGRQHLGELLSRGVAYHNSDLDWDLRDLVERHLRSGDIRVVVSTSTLGMGLNFPVRNVFIDRLRWTGPPWETIEISQAQYENEGGRAGRLAFGDDFGRSILVAERRIQLNALSNQYVRGELPPIQPSLCTSSLDDHIVNIVASRLAETEENVRKLLLLSFSGVTLWAEPDARVEFDEQFDGDMEKCLEGGLIKKVRGRLEATPLGMVCATTGISVDTCLVLAEWARDNVDDPLALSNEELLCTTVFSEDGDNYFQLTTPEFRSEDYALELLRRLSSREPELRERFAWIAGEDRRDYDFQKNMKKVCVLADWVGGIDTVRLEEEFQTFEGAVRNLASHFGWLIDALAKVMSVVGWHKDHVHVVATLGQRLPTGHRNPLGFVKQLRIPGLGRRRMQRLVDSGLSSKEQLAQATEEQLANIIGSGPVAKSLHGHILLARPPAGQPRPAGDIEEEAEEPEDDDVAGAHEEHHGDSQADERKRKRRRSNSNCTIQFDGEEDGQQSLVRIDGQEVWLAEGSFTNLLLFGAALHLNDKGHVHLLDLHGSGANRQMLVRRLRDKMESLVDCAVDRFIRAKGDGHFHMSVPAGNVSFDVDSLLEHSCGRVREVAEQLQELA